MLDPTKLAPQQHLLKVWDITTDGQTLENYSGGGFVATLNTNDPKSTPPKVAAGKGLLSRGRILTGTATIKNCQFSNITREPGIHSDGIWISVDLKASLTLNIIDVDVHAIAGEGLHVEQAGFKRLYLKNCTIKSDDGDRITVKLIPGARIEEIVLDGCSGNLVFDTSHLGSVAASTIVGKIFTNNHKGNVQQLPGVPVIAGLPGDLVTVPVVVPVQKDDVLGFSLHTKHGDEEYVSGHGDVSVKIDGFTYTFTKKESK